MAITWFSELRMLPGSADYIPDNWFSEQTTAAVQSGLIKAGLGSHESAIFVGVALIPTLLWAAAHARFLLQGKFVNAYLITKYLMVRVLCFVS